MWSISKFLAGLFNLMNSIYLFTIVAAVRQFIHGSCLSRARTQVYRLLAVALIFTVSNAQAQDEDSLAEFARKAQDPLGDVKALMTDNTIGFDGGPNEDTSYSFQLQPVYSLDTSGNWNMLF